MKPESMSIIIHYISTIYPLYIHYISTIYPLHIHYISTIYPLHIHYISTTYPLLSTTYALHIHYISTIYHYYPLHIHYISTIYPLHIHYISTIYPLLNHYYPLCNQIIPRGASQPWLFQDAQMKDDPAGESFRVNGERLSFRWPNLVGGDWNIMDYSGTMVHD